MTEPIHYTRARRERYLQELPLPVQVGAIIDELRELRTALNLQPAQSFTDLLAKIDAIKTEIPKS